MPQTRFVTKKALALGLKPIVVINKIDRPGARPNWVVDQTFDLFDKLGATDEQLDFPVVYASALNGFAGLELDQLADDMTPLFQTVIDRVPPPPVSLEAPFRMQISALDYSSYVGVIGIGRVTGGVAKVNSQVVIVDREGNQRKGKILQVKSHLGLERVDVSEASAGEIVCITGIDKLNISDTLCDPNHVEAMPPLTVDSPTISMTFQVNDSPFAGQDGKFVTTRNIKDRLERELIYNVALRVEPGDTPDKYKVSGRGELHLSVLIENMRREGFELTVGKPQVVTKKVDGKVHEPYEHLTIDAPEEYLGAITQLLAARKGRMESMVNHGTGWVRMEFIVPSRGLIGFRTEFLTATRGTGIANAIAHGYEEWAGQIVTRVNGSIVADRAGVVTPFAIIGLQERMSFFVQPTEEVYEGMVIGENSRADDMDVNITKEKKLTNMRSSTADSFESMTPSRQLSLEECLEFAREDECVEVTPETVRIRKVELDAQSRARNASRLKKQNE